MAAKKSSKKPTKKIVKASSKKGSSIKSQKKMTKTPTSQIQTVITSSIGIQPLGDRVIIKESEAATAERVTESGIIIPVSVNDDKGSKRGEVVAIGPGKYDDGVLVPPSVSLGDMVLFSWGDTVKVDGQEYAIVRESDIIAVLKK